MRWIAGMVLFVGSVAWAECENPLNPWWVADACWSPSCNPWSSPTCDDCLEYCENCCDEEYPSGTGCLFEWRACRLRCSENYQACWEEAVSGSMWFHWKADFFYELYELGVLTEEEAREMIDL